MKKFNAFIFLLSCMFIFIIGCDKDSKKENDDNGLDNVYGFVGDKVRYEAIISDETNYKIEASFTNKDGVLEELISDGKFTYERTIIKIGDFLNLAVYALPYDYLVMPNKTITARIFINGVLIDEDTGDISAMANVIGGKPK